MARSCRALHVTVLVLLVAAAPVARVSAAVTGGCSASAETTEANGWFTLSGSTAAGADGCYVACYDDATISPPRTCATVCSDAGFPCTAGQPQASLADCSAMLDSWLASPAKPAAVPASPPATGTQGYCTIDNVGGASVGEFLRTDDAVAMPWNSAISCGSEVISGSGGGDGLVMCRCDVPADTTAPTITSVTTAQTAPSSVTVSGTTDEAGTMYCDVRATGAAFTSADTKSAGHSASASAGSFSVTVTGVTGGGSKTAACVGEDAAGNLGSTPIESTAFTLDETAPVVADVAGSHSGTTATATGTSDEAGTVYCVVDTTGATVSAATVKAGGDSDTLAAAGAFSVTITAASVAGKSVFCVGEDAAGNLGSVVTGDFGEPPTDIALSAATIAENAAQGTDVGTLSTTDPDAGDTFTYTIVSQSVVDAFQISGDKLQAGSGALDFETTATIAVTVRSTDAGGLTFDKAFTITLTNENEAPTGIALSAAAIAENAAQATDVGTLSTTDPDAGDTFTYTITSQDVSDAFQISGDKLQAGSGVLDVEATATIAVTVRSTDVNGLSFDKEFTITLTNVNEVPTGMALSASTMTENSAQGTDVGTLSTTDPDAGDTFTYTITTQAVADAFQISGDKLQVGSGVLDFETTATIAVTVRSTDAGGLTFDKDFTITLTNENEVPTGMTLAGSTIAENSAQGTDVGTLSTTDPDAGDTFTFTIVSQAVTDAFQISGDKLQVGSGVLDFETTVTIAVTVRSTDVGGLTFDKDVTITLTNANEVATAMALSAATIAENSAQGTDVGTLSTTDPDTGDTFTYSITSQGVAGAFQISGDKLQVGSGVLDIETTAMIAVTVRSTDAGGLTFDKAFTITLINVNEVATAMGLAGSTIAENSAQATDVGTLSTTDPDAGDTFTYTITSQGVADAFQISGDKLQVGSGVLDFETTATIAVTVRSTDAGGLTFDKAFTITLTNVNEAPADVSLTSNSIAGDSTAQGSVVGTLSTTDPDAGDTFTYSIASQSAADAFQISGEELQAGPSDPSQANSTVITVTVTTTDAGGLTLTRAFDITVTKTGSTALMWVAIGVGAVTVVAGFAYALVAYSKHAATAAVSPVTSPA